MKTKFSVDENQKKNLFDLCTGIIMLLVVIGSFYLAPYTSNEAIQQYFKQEKRSRYD